MPPLVYYSAFFRVFSRFLNLCVGYVLVMLLASELSHIHGAHARTNRIFLTAMKLCHSSLQVSVNASGNPLGT
jgi:hypothetical protein